MITPDSPWWGLRQVRFSWVPPAKGFRTFGENELYEAYETPGYFTPLFSFDQTQYQSKYGEVATTDLGNNVWVLTVQRPGLHKYDTAEAPFWIDPQTNLGWLIALPIDSRQKSSARQNWKTVAQGIAFIVAVWGGVAAIGGFAGASATVGSAILGQSTAAAYPALSSAVGQIAITTAVSGGDVESAVKNFVVSYAAGTAGGFVGAGAAAATDSVAIGKVAAAVTRAFLAGGDIEQAAAMALLQYGATTPNIVSIESEPKMDFTFSNDVPSVETDYLNAGQSFLDPWAINPTLDPILTTSDYFNTDAFYAPALDFSSPAPVTTYTPAPAEPAPGAGFTWSDFNAGVQNLSQAALQVLNLRAVYDRVTAPTVTTPARSSGSAQVRVTDSGVIQTLTPDGRVTSQRPPAGQPHATVSGGIVINNGDGTYTLIDAQGNRRVVAYSGSAGPTATQSPLAGIIGGIGGPGLALAAGLAVLLLARRR